MVISIIILLTGFLLIGVYFIIRNYPRKSDDEEKSEMSKFVENEIDILDEILEKEQEKEILPPTKPLDENSTSRRLVEEEMYDEVHKEGKLSVLRKKKGGRNILDLNSSYEEEESEVGERRNKRKFPPRIDGMNSSPNTPRNTPDTPEDDLFLKIDHSKWDRKYSELRIELENRGYRDTTPQRNISKNYFCYNSPNEPWERFHFQTLYSSEEKKMIALAYFGPCVLGPGSVHGGAIMGLTLEIMKIFLRVHGLGKMEMFEAYGCMFMNPLPLDTVHIIEVVHERVKKDGNYEIKAEIKNLDDHNILYYIGRGEFNERKGGMVVIQEEEEQKRTALKGVEEMKESFMELVKYENYKHVKNYRSYHKYLQFENHFLNHDKKEGMTMSNYFNFKVLSKVEDMEAVYFIFFGQKAEGERIGFVHPSALIAMFDALAGLTPILMGYSNVKTNNLNVDFPDSDIQGSKIETLKLYKMVCRNKVLRKDVLKDKNLVRTKHKVTSSLRDVKGFRVHAMFSGVFIDHKKLISDL